MNDKECKMCGKIFQCNTRYAKKYRETIKYCSHPCYSKTLLGKDPAQLKGHLHRLGVKTPKEVKDKISKANTGHLVTEETREKIRIAKKGQPSGLKNRTFPERRKENSPRWKGGYENKLMHNKNRRALALNAIGSHTLEEWQELKKKYNYMCLCCKQQEPFITLSEDHIVPLTLNGSNNIENIQPLCRSCNSRKYNKIINFTELLETIKAAE